MRKVEKYERLQRIVLAWTKLHILRLALFGPAGVGKSYAYKVALGNHPYHLFTGRQSPLHVYKTLCDAPHLPVVLDDISALLRDDNYTDMLKGLVETGQRVVRWGTTTSKLEGRPMSFVPTGPVLIILNKLPANDPDVEAILDRCDAIRFEPTKPEIIAHMREVFPDNQDLIDVIAELPTVPSLRTLTHALDWQRSDDLNVVEELLSECGVSPEISQLVEIMQTSPEREWCERYMQRTGLTDRTYRRHRRFADQIVECRRCQSRPALRGDGATQDRPDVVGGPNSSPRTNGPVISNGGDSMGEA